MNNSDKTLGTIKADILVLLADNDLSRRQNTEAYLSSAGFRVSTALDGFEALAGVVEDTPDIIFADACMPRLDGYQFCSLIKSNADFQRVPVVIMVRDADAIESERTSLCGCDAQLCAPANPQAFASEVFRFVPAATQS